MWRWNWRWSRPPGSWLPRRQRSPPQANEPDVKPWLLLNAGERTCRVGCVWGGSHPPKLLIAPDGTDVAYTSGRPEVRPCSTRVTKLPHRQWKEPNETPRGTERADWRKTPPSSSVNVTPVR